MADPLTKPTALQLTMLGTGDAFASHGRFQSGYIISSGAYRILLEAGPTALCALKRQQFDPAAIDLILISHLHGDHFGGLPFFLLEYIYESPRKKKLTIAGPRHLEERTWRLFRTMFPRPSGALEKLANKLRFVVIEPGETKRIGPVKITAMRTPHMKRDISLALRLEFPGKTIAFSGDSGWTEELVPFVAGADLFLCECTYFDSTEFDFHINYPKLSASHTRFDVGRLVITHLGREVLEHMPEIMLEMAGDGMRIDL